jgi:hypothetical protein
MNPQPGGAFLTNPTQVLRNAVGEVVLALKNKMAEYGYFLFEYHPEKADEGMNIDGAWAAMVLYAREIGVPLFNVADIIAAAGTEPVVGKDFEVKLKNYATGKIETLVIQLHNKEVPP